MASNRSISGAGKRGGGATRRLVWAAALCALAGSTQAGEQDRVGLRLNAGASQSPGGGLANLGLAVDAPLGRVVDLFADGQVNAREDAYYATLSAGTRVQPWRSRALSPYLTVGAGVWTYYPGEFSPVEPYAFVGLGASLRLSRRLTAFGEIRTRPLFAGKSDFETGIPVMFGARFGI